MAAVSDDPINAEPDRQRPGSVGECRAALRGALTGAMKRRDRDATNALRSAIGAIDNAEAADQSAAPVAQSAVIAGGVAGLGAGEVARLELTLDDAVAIIRAEITERRAAADEYDALGQTDRATALRNEAIALEPFATT